MGNLTTAERARFDTRWISSGKPDCHLWQGPLDRDGYGSFFLRSRGRRAHRVAWFDQNGEIPEGHVINHTCRNRSCVNPQHLQCIPVGENALRDSTSLGYINSQKERCPEGHPYDAVEKNARRGTVARVCSSCRKVKRAAAAKRRRDASTLRV